MPCKFPEHHNSGTRSGPGIVAFAVVVAVAYVVVRLVLVVVHFFEAWWWTFALALAVVAAGWLLTRSKIRWHIPVHPRLRNLARAVWAASRWHHLTRNLDLARPDKHLQGKVRRPRAIILPDAHGVVAKIRTVPGTGRAELEAASEHIGNYWRVQRVSVTQPRPGRVHVRGLVRDPLLRTFGIEAAPPGTYDGTNPARLWLGIGEDGRHRFLELANISGLILSGVPGAGKSVELSSFLMQWCPSLAVQPATFDGKGGSEYEEFADRCWISSGLDLDEAVSNFETLVGTMETRLASVRDFTHGKKNVWSTGISEEWPLLPTLIDECQRYLDLTSVKGDREAEKKVARCIALVADLMRRGRSVAMFTVCASQKVTADSCPSSVRDNAPMAMSFAVKTSDAAVAALGADIRQYPSFSPVMFLDRAYAGCAVLTQRNGQDPFTRLRAPFVTEDQAAEVATASADLRRDPRVTLPVVVPDDASTLVGS